MFVTQLYLLPFEHENYQAMIICYPFGVYAFNCKNLGNYRKWIDKDDRIMRRAEIDRIKTRKW
jgi:hypothetical protein